MVVATALVIAGCHSKQSVKDDPKDIMDPIGKYEPGLFSNSVALTNTSNYFLVHVQTEISFVGSQGQDVVRIERGVWLPQETIEVKVPDTVKDLQSFSIRGASLRRTTLKKIRVVPPGSDLDAMTEQHMTGIFGSYYAQ